MATSFQRHQSLAVVNASRTCLYWHDANVVNTNTFLVQSPSNLTCYANADSIHILIFTMNSALGPPSIIDRACDAVTRQRTHAIASRLALPSMFILIAYLVCRMCTKICRLVSVSWLFFSFHAHTNQASLCMWHIFPLQLTNECKRMPAWTLYVDTNLVSTENRDQLLTNQNSELQ